MALVPSPRDLRLNGNRIHHPNQLGLAHILTKDCFMTLQVKLGKAVPSAEALGRPACSRHIVSTKYYTSPLPSIPALLYLTQIPMPHAIAKKHPTNPALDVSREPLAEPVGIRSALTGTPGQVQLRLCDFMV